jgi:hypothetical protein
MATVTEVYGRKSGGDTKLRAGTPLHLYLPGPHRGRVQRSGVSMGQSEEAILCEALDRCADVLVCGLSERDGELRGSRGSPRIILDAFTAARRASAC